MLLYETNSEILTVLLWPIKQKFETQTHVSHITSLVSGLEQWVEKSLSFDTCKITCDVTLLNKAILFLELAVTAERTRFISLK